MPKHRKWWILLCHYHEYSSDLIDSLKMSLGSWMSMDAYFENHFPNLCGLFCQSCNGSSQPRLSLLWPVSTCLLVISRLIVSYALTDGRISGQAIVKSDFPIPWKRWNCLEYFGGISRVKDHRSVCHLPVVCSPRWYPVSQMLDPWWWCFGDSGRAQGRSRVWLLYVQYPYYVSAAKLHPCHYK